MDGSRRQFVFVLAGAAAARRTFAQGRAKRSIDAERRTIVERRVYDRSGVVPPASVLRRCGLDRFHRHDEPPSATLKSGTLSPVTFLMLFASLEERARAWDRFNTDPEWCRLRESGPVRLQEISFPPLNGN